MHGMAIEPRDVDVLATDDAAATIGGLFRAAMVADDRPYERANMRADRRLGIMLGGVQIEVLTNLRNVVAGAEGLTFDLAAAVRSFESRS
jgi:hypothetical protein